MHYMYPKCMLNFQELNDAKFFTIDNSFYCYLV